MFFYVNLLKFIGIVLIVNSHMDEIYPISGIATGGAIGNALFFLCSGYCLYGTHESFFMWYKKRILRIYPITWIVTVMLLLIGYIKLDKVTDIFKYFVYPTNYWFIGAIAIFYCLYYFLMSADYSAILMKAAGAISLILYVCTYLLIDTSIWIVEENIVTRYLFYFWVMILGGWLRKNDMVNIKIKLFHIIMILIVYFGLKIFMLNSVKFMHFQFITQVLTYPFILCIFFYFKNMESSFRRVQSSAGKVFVKTVSYFAGLSLEIYVIHMPLIYYCKTLGFPFNLFLIITGTLFFAVIVHYICNDLIQNICNMRKRA